MAVDAVFPNASVLEAFGLTEHPVALQGGEGRTFLSGTVVLRKEEDEKESSWTAELFNQIHANGFRSARPLRTRSSDWIALGGWSAWTYLEGHPASKADVPQVVPAIIAFHEAIAGFAYVPTLHQRESAYMHADRGAWLGEVNVQDARIARFLERLSEVRRPLSFLPEQLIHGDLNPSNILIASGSWPAIIDLAPYWRPAGFASAVAAFWFGPYRGDPAPLHHFGHLPQFAQLLVRAAWRLVLIKDRLKSFDDLDWYTPAIDIVVRYVEQTE